MTRARVVLLLMREEQRSSRSIIDLMLLLLLVLLLIADDMVTLLLLLLLLLMSLPEGTSTCFTLLSILFQASLSLFSSTGLVRIKERLTDFLVGVVIFNTAE